MLPNTAYPWIGLLSFLLLSALAAATGVLFQPGTWYAGLMKPGWTPPNWLFPAAWTVLYIMMALAAWLVWRRSGFAGAPLALGLYLAQLAANAAWSWLFFGQHWMMAGLLDIVLLFVLIAATVLAFRAHSIVAASLMLPYLAWVGYAGVLNAALLGLNQGWGFS